MRGRRLGDDDGESLVELLVALAIMATAVAVLLAGLATAILMSDVHRKQATAGAHVRAFAEKIAGVVAAYPSGYETCADKDDPDGYQAQAPSAAGFSFAVTKVEYWDGSAFTTSTSACDRGVQRVTVRVASADGRAAESLTVVLRRPCRTQDDFPQDWPCP